MEDYDFLKWKRSFEALSSEIEYFRKKFDAARTCDCSIEECGHYKKQRNMLFGREIDILYDYRMGLGFDAFSKNYASMG